MIASKFLKLLIEWHSAVADLRSEAQESQTQNLYRSLRRLPDLERVSHIPDSSSPYSSLSSAWLMDLLLTENFSDSFNSILTTIQ